MGSLAAFYGKRREAGPKNQPSSRTAPGWRVIPWLTLPSVRIVAERTMSLPKSQRTLVLLLGLAIIAGAAFAWGPSLWGAEPGTAHSKRGKGRRNTDGHLSQ